MSTRQDTRSISSSPTSTRPISDAEYEDLCECRCPRLPGTHAAGQCLARPIAS